MKPVMQVDSFEDAIKPTEHDTFNKQQAIIKELKAKLKEVLAEKAESVPS